MPQNKSPFFNGFQADYYEEIYNNRTHYESPVEFTDRRYFVYTLPSFTDPEEDVVTMSLKNSIDETFMKVEKNDKGAFSRIVFDKLMIPFDKSLNESSDGKETFKQSTDITLTDYFNNSNVYTLTINFMPPFAI